VARGSLGAKSRLRGVLRPFLPLHISWVARSDLGSLTGAEAAGVPAGLRGDAMLSAYYVNELLLHFLHRHDPQAEIFALYAETVMALGANAEIASVLRSFEIEFLSLLGYAVGFEHESGTLRSLDPDQNYEYRMEQGAVPVSRSSGPLIFTGAMLSSIHAQHFGDPEVLRAAGRLLREVISHHLGGKELKSRKVLLDLHRGRIASDNKRKRECD